MLSHKETVGPCTLDTSHEQQGLEPPREGGLEIIGRRSPEDKARDALCRARATLRLTHPRCFVGGRGARRSCEAVRDLDMELAEIELALDELAAPPADARSAGEEEGESDAQTAPARKHDGDNE